ncbi:hypothetical protein CFC21_005654 [Triticum aestivum]|uniref:Uncharacterized protein n=3 Tax=Triticum TaxID=4564 RepID=A0A9R0QM62_TRITD|nr:hypothetical protein CFC21_005654 [Triticum aestivum]VAH14104.1 unnamed protein product [Triticum turgidum subsp. durum]
MASMTRETPVARFVEEEEDDLVGDDSGDDGAGGAGEVRRRVSRFAVDGGSGSGGSRGVLSRRQEGARTLPPPHAWLAVEDTKKSFGSDNEEHWARLLQRGSAQAEAAQPRRSSFSVVRRERAAREAWLDRAWEMKKSWHERNGGAPDADTPVVVVVGKQTGGSSSPCASSSPHHHSSASVAMDMEEVRACRDLGLELPSDGTVEIQCYGISAGSSPTHSHASSGADSPSTAGSCSISSPSAGEDPVDVKARLKVWAQAVALASTTRLGS